MRCGQYNSELWSEVCCNVHGGLHLDVWRSYRCITGDFEMRILDAKLCFLCLQYFLSALYE